MLAFDIPSPSLYAPTSREDSQSKIKSPLDEENMFGFDKHTS
jgi:hypothetical protein